MIFYVLMFVFAQKQSIYIILFSITIHVFLLFTITQLNIVSFIFIIDLYIKYKSVFLYKI